MPETSTHFIKLKVQVLKKFAMQGDTPAAVAARDARVEKLPRAFLPLHKVCTLSLHQFIVLKRWKIAFAGDPKHAGFANEAGPGF